MDAFGRVHLPNDWLYEGYRYSIVHLKDGHRVCLNHNKSYLDFALDDYFKTVPIQRIPHKIPWILPV
ncbi:hypothetical protein GCM10027347_37010 [Larkinella harenae]